MMQTNTPYHPSEAYNLGTVLQTVVGGVCIHTTIRSADQSHKGDDYGILPTTRRVQPEQLEAQVASFLERQGFFLAEKQPESKVLTISPEGERKMEHKGNFTSSGSLQQYMHPSTPALEYLVSLGVSNKFRFAGIKVILVYPNLSSSAK